MGYLWLGSTDPGLRLDPGALSMYHHPDLLPWPSYQRVIRAGSAMGVIMRTYGTAHLIDGSHLLARGLHGQFVDDQGPRLLHPSECRALMALPSFHADSYVDAWRLIGSALPGTFAVRAIGVWLHTRHGVTFNLADLLLRLVATTQADFAARTPPSLRCSNAATAAILHAPRRTAHKQKTPFLPPTRPQP